MLKVNAMHIALLLVLALILGSRAQDSCITPLNKSGTCINIRQCQPLVDVLRRPRPLSAESLQLLTQSQCGFEGNDPKVCCELQQATEKPNVVTTVPEPPSVLNHPNLRLLRHDICGPLGQEKIFGGNKTGLFDYPWMALVAYAGSSGDVEFRCGASLINKRYVLTAAHCVTTLPAGFQIVGVRVGEHDINTEVDCVKGADDLEELCAERYQDFGIEEVIYHPAYSRSKLQNDIALLRLNGDVDFRPRSVRPICLPINPASALNKQKVIVTGWGATEYLPRSQDLLQVQLSVVPTEECAQAYKGKSEIWYKQMCAGGKKSMDSCVGDSGGPLQAPGMYRNNLRFIQYGIVSYGLKSCGTEGVPGVYTRLTYYMDWLLDNMRE